MNYVIIGNGVAGINAALTIRKTDKKSSVIVISNETPYFFSRTALMYIAMGDMRLEDTEPFERNYYEKNNIQLLTESVDIIDWNSNTLHLESGDKIPYHKLLLATGSEPAMFGWPGSDLKGVVNFVSHKDLQNVISYKNKAQKAVIVGGGLIGIELAEVLLSYGMEVAFIIREETFWPRALSPEEGRLIESLMEHHGIRVMMNTEFSSINGENGKVTSVTTGAGETLETDLVGITTGVFPAKSLAEKSGIDVNRGILVNSKMETNIPDIYGAGDCVEREETEPATAPVISIWYTSRDMGTVAGQNMTGESISYSMGDWYNSAKFFDLEYTSVGQYLPENPGEENVYIENESRTASIRVVHKNDIVAGFSMIGSRWDHRVLLKFIKEKRTVHDFFRHLEEARFDPEFTKLPDIPIEMMKVKV